MRCLDVAATSAGADDLASLRRRAIWGLYRYGGMRLAELAWTIDTNFPRIEIEESGQWTVEAGTFVVVVPLIAKRALKKYHDSAAYSPDASANLHDVLFGGCRLVLQSSFRRLKPSAYATFTT